jgi:hypothetical protein
VFPGSAGTVGAGFNGAGGTTNSASWGSSRAITSGKALGRGAQSAGALVWAELVPAIDVERGLSLGVLRDAFPGEAPVAAFVFGLAVAVGVLLGLLAGAGRACRGLGGLNVTIAG